MFQASPLSHDSEYLIQKRSSLETLNPNACPRFSLQMASSGQTSSDTPKYSHKRVVQNPLLHRKPDDEQGRRRQVFLDKVRQVSADKKWESRSEQVCGHNSCDSPSCNRVDDITDLENGLPIEEERVGT